MPMGPQESGLRLDLRKHIIFDFWPPVIGETAFVGLLFSLRRVSRKL